MGAGVGSGEGFGSALAMVGVLGAGSGRDKPSCANDAFRLPTEFAVMGALDVLVTPSAFSVAVSRLPLVCSPF